jgi:hypothetical protein
MKSKPQSKQEIRAEVAARKRARKKEEREQFGSTIRVLPLRDAEPQIPLRALRIHLLPGETRSHR